MTAAADSVLVVGPAWAGDMVMAQSLFMKLKAQRPDCRLDVLAPAWSQPLLARMPEVDNAIGSPFAHGELSLNRRRRLGKQLRGSGYQQAIVLPNSFKSALAPWFARIPRRTGWRGEWRYGLLNDVRILDKAKLPLMVQRFVALGLEANSPVGEPPRPRLRVEPGEGDICRQKFLLHVDAPILALCPGAEFGPAKCWPSRYFANLAETYLERGWQVLLLGSTNDRQVTSEVKEACGENSLCLDLAGRTKLEEAVDLLSLAAAVVTNDSGLMHIAAALGRPLVAVYGPTSPDFTPPLGNRIACKISDIDCAPCFKRTCPLGHHRCMQEIEPAQVSEQLDMLLSSAG